MTLTKKIIWLTIFSIAMGFMEAVIVVYLRKLYYPDGFQFPLVAMEYDIAKAEFLRETATIIMLLSIGVLTGKTASQKFAFFIFCFAIWDIFYYVFLKMLLDWPESLFTWDILFLIPVPWIGPVLAPCIVSVTMIVLTLCIIYFQELGRNTRINIREWMLFSAGSLLIIFSFVRDTVKFISCSTEKQLNHTMPSDYNWWLFWTGETVIIFCIYIYLKRINKEHIDKNNLVY